MAKSINIPKRILEIALRESRKSNINKARLSAMVVDKKWNIVFKTHNVKVLGHKSIFSLHAEDRLITKYRDTIDTMLIFRNIMHKYPSTSKPCPRCMVRIKESGVRNIIYFDGLCWVKERI